jgi:hypothetical protein
MEFELERFEGWKVKGALAALALLLVLAPAACAVKKNKDRAEDWHRRAIVAEESVGGLRAVIAQRSRALNQRTLQANRLVGRVNSSGKALRQSKASVGALARRQSTLTSENARIAKESRKAQAREATLETIASKLAACGKGLGSAVQAPVKRGRRAASPAVRSLLASCRKTGDDLDSFLRQSP